MPAQVTRGSTANTTPAVTATDRVDSCLPSTTTPAAATPTVSALDNRARNSVAGKTANQPCINR